MWRKSWREIALGAGLAGVAFLVLRGADLTPFLLLGGAMAALYFLTQGRGAGNFEALGVGGAPRSTGTVTFADIGGQEMAKRELVEALDFLRDMAEIGRASCRERL